MAHRNPKTTAAVLLSVLALVSACGDSGGSSPTPPAAAPSISPATALSISSLSPATGPAAGGTSVTVTGTNFASGATVSFGRSAGAVAGVTATSITVTTPARAAGPADVTVLNPDGGSATSVGAFTFVAPTSGNPPPVITSLSPASGPPAGGGLLVISGSGFVPGAAVGFGGVQASQAPGAVTASSISATIPAHALGVVDITVANPDGQVTTRPGGYTYVGPAPTIQALNVRGGPTAGGTEVRASGSGFVAGVTVAVGGKPATNISLVNLGLGTVAVSFFTPPQPEGLYDVVFTNPDGQSATVANGFHYGPAPVITGVACSNGCDAVTPGDLITISGANFDGVGVQFAGTDVGQQGGPGTVQSATPTQIVVVAPKLDGGIPVRRYFVVVNNLDGQTAVAANPVTYK